MDELSFRCGHCETEGNFTFKSDEDFKTNHQVKISIHNLPDGITEEGVRNLFLSIGEPVSLHFNEPKKLAYIQLESLNQAELAIRDLHKKPPFYLNVALSQNKPNKLSSFFNSCMLSNHLNSDNDLSEKFVAKEITFEGILETNNDTVQRSVNIRNLCKTVDYGPSYKVHHKNCDFKVPFGLSACLGRGYFYSGPKERQVGGFKICKYTSAQGDKSVEDYFQDETQCENCDAPSVQMCSNCLVPFCSTTCMNESSKHRESECFSGLNQKSTISKINPSFKRDVVLDPVSTVTITMFPTIQTAFVRRVDSLWEEEFVKLNNDVAIKALRENCLESLPEVNEMYSAKYYEDGSYYRGEVVSSNEGKPIISFVDFGNVQETDLKDLKPLKEDLKIVPRLAVKVNLNGVPEGTSAEAISYLNKLTSESVTLTLKFNKSLSDGVTLIEKDSGEVVNDKLRKMILPSWWKDVTVFSKLGEVFYVESIPNQILEMDKTYSLTVSYVDEREFSDDGCFWLINKEDDYFQYLKEEVRAKIAEYCEYLREDFYLPRESELCLAYDNEEWQRCVCLSSVGTTCWLFFMDDGKTSFIDTKNIRKMVGDFLECPQQAIRCVLSNKASRKEKSREKVLEYLKSVIGKTLNFIVVKKYEDGDHYIIVPEIEKLLEELSVDGN